MRRARTPTWARRELERKATACMPLRDHRWLTSDFGARSSLMLIARCCAGRPAIWSHPRAISGTSQGGGTQCGHLAAPEGDEDSLIACGVAYNRTTSRGMGARKCMTLLAMGRTHCKDRLPAASMFLVSQQGPSACMVLSLLLYCTPRNCAKDERRTKKNLPVGQ